MDANWVAQHSQSSVICATATAVAVGALVSLLLQAPFYLCNVMLYAELNLGVLA